MKRRPKPEDQEGIIQGIFTRPEVGRLGDFIAKYGKSIERRDWTEKLKKAGLSSAEFPFDDEREIVYAGFDNDWCPDEDNDFCAIVESYYAYVVRSKWGIKGTLMNGMFPPQVNSRMAGEWIGYSFPPDLVTEADIRARIFRLTGDECLVKEPTETEVHRQTQKREQAQKIGHSILSSQISMLESLFSK